MFTGVAAVLTINAQHYVRPIEGIATFKKYKDCQVSKQRTEQRNHQEMLPEGWRESGVCTSSTGATKVQGLFFMGCYMAHSSVFTTARHGSLFIKLLIRGDRNDLVERIEGPRYGASLPTRSSLTKTNGPLQNSLVGNWDTNIKKAASGSCLLAARVPSEPRLEKQPLTCCHHCSQQNC